MRGSCNGPLSYSAWVAFFDPSRTDDISDAATRPPRGFVRPVPRHPPRIDAVKAASTESVLPFRIVACR